LLLEASHQQTPEPNCQFCSRTECVVASVLHGIELQAGFMGLSYCIFNLHILELELLILLPLPPLPPLLALTGKLDV
jgi:hypothetical protein